MPQTNQNVSHPVGDSLTLNIGPVKEQNGTTNADLTGATARWWLAKKVKSTGADIIVEKSTSDGIAITEDTGAFTVVVTIDPADTEGQKATAYYHECEVVDAAGSISTVMTGTFTLTATLIPDVL